MSAKERRQHRLQAAQATAAGHAGGGKRARPAAAAGLGLGVGGGSSSAAPSSITELLEALPEAPLAPAPAAAPSALSWSIAARTDKPTRRSAVDARSVAQLAAVISDPAFRARPLAALQRHIEQSLAATDAAVPASAAAKRQMPRK